MTEELKPCPFCGSAPVMKHIGNDHTKSRAVEVKCSNVYCRVARTDKALRHDHEWLTKVATENWNRRPKSLAAPAVANGAAEPEPTIIGGRFFYTAQQMQAASAASTQQAAPRQALTDDQLADIWINRDCMDAIRAGDIRAQFICAARAAIAASAPNALLVAALKEISSNLRDHPCYMPNATEQDIENEGGDAGFITDQANIAEAALASIPTAPEDLP